MYFLLRKKYSLSCFLCFFSFFNTISHLILLYYHTSIHPKHYHILKYHYIIHIHTYKTHTPFSFSSPYHSSSYYCQCLYIFYIYIYIYTYICHLFSTTTWWCSWTCSTRSHSSICISLFPFCWF